MPFHCSKEGCVNICALRPRKPPFLCKECQVEVRNHKRRMQRKSHHDFRSKGAIEPTSHTILESEPPSKAEPHQFVELAPPSISENVIKEKAVLTVDFPIYNYFNVSHEGDGIKANQEHTLALEIKKAAQNFRDCAMAMLNSVCEEE